LSRFQSVYAIVATIVIGNWLKKIMWGCNERGEMMRDFLVESDDDDATA
jgi:hypothetical protein